MMKDTELNVVLMILIIVMIAVNLYREGFANKREKAFSMYNWFAANSEPTYTQYKRDFKDANIVEYEDILRLKQTGKLTQANVALNI